MKTDANSLTMEAPTRGGDVAMVRWGLAELSGVLHALSISRPLLISTERWRHVEIPVDDRFHGVRARSRRTRPRRQTRARR
jgi:hypothetical protein